MPPFTADNPQDPWVTEDGKIYLATGDKDDEGGRDLHVVKASTQ